MEVSPQFLPDGKRILFEQRTKHLSPRLSDERPDTCLVLYDRTTREMRFLSNGGRLFFPKLAPDGRTVACNRAVPGSPFPDLWLLDTEDGGLWQIDSGKRLLILGWAMTWTPDSQYVLFPCEGDVYAVGRTGKGPFQLTPGLGIPELYGRTFSVHPDGKQIAFADGQGSVMVAELDWRGVPGYEEAAE